MHNSHHNSQLKSGLSAWVKSKTCYATNGSVSRWPHCFIRSGSWSGRATSGWLLGLPVIFDLYITVLPLGCLEPQRRCASAAKTYRTVYEWVNAIIRDGRRRWCISSSSRCVVIPTSSMERTLLIGDYLYVSKVAYGPQMPNTPLSFPSYTTRCPSFADQEIVLRGDQVAPTTASRGSPIRRNDVVVQLPGGRHGAARNQNVTCYDTLRSFGVVRQGGGTQTPQRKIHGDQPPGRQTRTSIKRCVGFRRPARSPQRKGGSTANRRRRYPDCNTTSVVQTRPPSRSTPSTTWNPGVQRLRLGLTT